MCQFTRKVVFLIFLIVPHLSHALDEKLPFFLKKELTPIWNIAPFERSQLAKLSEFELKNHHGKKIQSEDLRGKITVVNFFFASCGGICPMLMERLKKVHKRIHNVDNLNILSITVTPKFDTPQKLFSYAKEKKILFDNWQLLTGKIDQIRTFAEESFQAAKRPRGQTEDRFVHPDHLYLIDQNLNIRGIYVSSNRVFLDYLVDDISKISKKEKSLE